MMLYKAALFLIILLTFFKGTEAQRICPHDGYIGLLYLEKKGEVIIKTRNTAGVFYGSIYRFKYIDGVVKCKLESYDSSDYDQDYEESNYYHYPGFVKIRNNDFLLSISKTDSLIMDSKGRVIEVYRKMDNQLAHDIRIKFRYINDTTILEMSKIPDTRDSNRVYVYELDSKLNLKAIKEGEFKNDFFTVGVNDIEVYNITKFNYDRNNVRINSIEEYTVDGNKKSLQSTQTFIYKNTRPIKSSVYDVKKKAVLYEQTYTYSL